MKSWILAILYINIHIYKYVILKIFAKFEIRLLKTDKLYSSNNANLANVCDSNTANQFLFKLRPCYLQAMLIHPLLTHGNLLTAWNLQTHGLVLTLKWVSILVKKLTHQMIIVKSFLHELAMTLIFITGN